MAGDEATTLAVARGDCSLLQPLNDGGHARLILYSGADAGLSFELPPGSTVIGRSGDADVHIDSAGVSRRHAVVDVDTTGAVLRDLGSANGSWVNDVQVASEVALAEGDVVRLGASLLRFHARGSLDAVLHERMHRSMRIDGVTGVHNRRHLLQALRRAMRSARSGGTPLSLLCFDLDHFKQVNDRYGHPAGDAVLRQSAALMNATLLGPGFVFGRLGGEEFAAVLPQVASAEASSLAESACLAVAGHDGFAHGHRQTVSAGVAQLTPTMGQPIELVAAADRALYAAKNGGRNRVVVA